MSARSFLDKRRPLPRLERRGEKIVVKGISSRLHREDSVDSILPDSNSLRGVVSTNPMAMDTEATKPLGDGSVVEVAVPNSNSPGSSLSSGYSNGIRSVVRSLRDVKVLWRKDNDAEAYQRMIELMNRYWSFMLKANPERATLLGIHDYDEELFMLAKETNEAMSDIVFSSEELLKRIVPSVKVFKGWTRDEVATFQVFQEELFIAKSNLADRAFLMPVTEFEGPHITLPNLVRHMNFRSSKDFEIYKERMSKVQQQIDLVVRAMKRGLVEHITPPKQSVERAHAQINRLLLQDPSVFQAPIDQYFLDNTPDNKESRKLKRKLEKEISLKVLPAFARLANFIRDEYLPALKDEISLPKRLPRGNWVYQNSIRRILGTCANVDLLHEKGLQEVQRIHALMKELSLKEILAANPEAAVDDMENVVREYSRNLFSDPSQSAVSKEQLLNWYRASVMEVLPGLSKILNTIPILVPGVRESPPIVEKYSPLVSLSSYPPARASPNTVLEGWLEVNCAILSSHKRYTTYATALRMVSPGAFVSNAVQSWNDEIPNMRRLSWRFAGAVEGWKHYAEGLCDDIGLSISAESRLGVLERQISEAVLLVVDTGIHMKGWSEAEALDYAEKYAVQPWQAQAIVHKALAMPGSCNAAKLGELKIRELRQRCQNRLGEAFSLAAFHDLVLTIGPVPLQLLDDLVDEWAEALGEDGNRGSQIMGKEKAVFGMENDTVAP